MKSQPLDSMEPSRTKGPTPFFSQLLSRLDRSGAIASAVGRKRFEELLPPASRFHRYLFHQAHSSKTFRSIPQTTFQELLCPNFSTAFSIDCRFFSTPSNKSPTRSKRSSALLILNCFGSNLGVTSFHANGVATGAPGYARST